MIFHPCINDLTERYKALSASIQNGRILLPEAIGRYAWLVKDASNSLAISHMNSVEPTEIDDSAHSIPAVITTADEDRDGDVVVPAGCQFRNYGRNPVVFFGHQEHPFPIAKAMSPDGRVAVYPSESNVKAVSYFDVHDPDAEFVYGKIKRGFISATSVAFVPIEAYRRDREQEKWINDKAKPHRDPDAPAGWYFKTWDMTEFSWVGVPSNAGAIRDIYDQEKSFMSPKLCKAWLPYTAKGVNESGGCFVAFDGTWWCPRSVEKSDLSAGGKPTNKGPTGSKPWEEAVRSAMKTLHQDILYVHISDAATKAAKAAYDKEKRLDRGEHPGDAAYEAAKVVIQAEIDRVDREWNKGLPKKSCGCKDCSESPEEKCPCSKEEKITWTPTIDDVKPKGCTCKDYPRLKMRNGSGHRPECPYHKSWEEQGGFNRNKDAGTMTGGGTDVDHPNVSGQPFQKAAGLYFIEKRPDGWYAVLKEEDEELGPFKSRSEATQAAEKFGKEHQSNGHSDKSVVGSPEWAAEEAQEPEHQSSSSSTSTKKDATKPGWKPNDKPTSPIRSIKVGLKTDNWPRLTAQRYIKYMQDLGYKVTPQLGKDGSATTIMVQGDQSKIHEDMHTALRWVDPLAKYVKALVQADMESGRNQAGEIDRTKSAKTVRYVQANESNKLGPDEEGWYVYENGQMVDGPYDSKAEADRESMKTKQYKHRVHKTLFYSNGRMCKWQITQERKPGGGTSQFYLHQPNNQHSESVGPFATRAQAVAELTVRNRSAGTPVTEEKMGKFIRVPTRA